MTKVAATGGGGACAVHVAVTAAELRAADEVGALHAVDDAAACGAAACFVGRGRGGAVRAMTLEHYPGMTEAALTRIVEAAMARWQLDAVRVVHRIGRLQPGEEIVFVGVLSRHRQAAFDACAFITDFLKTEAPFWKKEERADGAVQWVAARAQDEAARDKWHQQKQPPQQPD